jgi:hypothetical protein
MEEHESRKKDRSPNFPFISLESAIARARAFYDEERKGAAPVTRAAIHWKYSPNSSGLIQTVAALKSYGLMSDEGSGADRRLKLTELALRIVLDTRIESLERQEMIRRAALNPSVSAEVHSNWPEGLPSDDTLNHYLVLERAFAPANASRAVKILKENQQLAGILGDSNLSEEVEIVGDRSARNVGDGLPLISGMDVVESPRLTNTQLTNHPRFYGGGSPAMTAPAGAFIEQVLDLDGRAMRIEFSVAPTEDMYEFLKDYIELRLKAIRRKATSPQP